MHCSSLLRAQKASLLLLLLLLYYMYCIPSKTFISETSLSFYAMRAEHIHECLVVADVAGPAQSLSDIKVGQADMYSRAFRAAPARRALDPSWATATHVGLCLCCVSRFLTLYSRAADIFIQLQRLFAVDIKPCFF